VNKRSFSLKKLLVLVLTVCGVPVLLPAAGDPFGVAFRETTGPQGHLVVVSVSLPPLSHIYADQMTAESDAGEPLTEVGGAKPVRIHDAFSDSDRDLYTNDVTLVYLAKGSGLTFTYQGCGESECFFPQTRSFKYSATAVTPAPSIAGEATAVNSWRDKASALTVAGRASGYLNTSDFLAFLDRAEGKGPLVTGNQEGFREGVSLFSTDPVEFFRRHGVMWTVLLILLGGLLLNLTPCVLPMIPINLAIIGVGAQNGTRARGAFLGSAYGLGIALVYGALGLVVVLTGSQFGTLNSMPWFNAIIGGVFVVLALALFDVLAIDFTRFQSVGGASPGRGGAITALAMGGVAALLAGACVAPVVIAVLLLSSNLYVHGVTIGLALPFVLGLGMAAPWPLAGAGLSFLPKPGAWMTWVKYGFGIFILLFALYYFSLAYHGWRGGPAAGGLSSGGVAITAAESGKWAGVLAESVRQKRPVFVDFWATWCKNCEAMELTTFRDAEVKRRLAGYTVVKFQAEKLTDAATRDVVGYYEVKGLPTYVVLSPGPQGH